MVHGQYAIKLPVRAAAKKIRRQNKAHRLVRLNYRRLQLPAQCFGIFFTNNPIISQHVDLIPIPHFRVSGFRNPFEARCKVVFIFSNDINTQHSCHFLYRNMAGNQRHTKSVIEHKIISGSAAKHCPRNSVCPTNLNSSFVHCFIDGWGYQRVNLVFFQASVAFCSEIKVLPTNRGWFSHFNILLLSRNR